MADFDRDGFLLLPRAAPLAAFEALFPPGSPTTRDLWHLLPALLGVFRGSEAADAVRADLGPGAGLVRALFLDKPPGRGWGVGPHRDLVVALRSPAQAPFRAPTLKSGVHHAEAPAELLDRMLSARVHLDAADAENGALAVRPGSHRGEGGAEVLVPAGTGDVLLLRPRLIHRSGRPSAQRRRRVVHLEFAPAGEAVDWNAFLEL